MCRAHVVVGVGKADGQEPLRCDRDHDVDRGHLGLKNITNLDKFNLVKICNGGLVLGSSQFSLLPKLPQKMMLASKVVTIESKIVISLC